MSHDTRPQVTWCTFHRNCLRQTWDNQRSLSTNACKPSLLPAIPLKLQTSFSALFFLAHYVLHVHGKYEVSWNFQVKDGRFPPHLDICWSHMIFDIAKKEIMCFLTFVWYTMEVPPGGNPRGMPTNVVICSSFPDVNSWGLRKLTDF